MNSDGVNQSTSDGRDNLIRADGGDVGESDSGEEDLHRREELSSGLLYFTRYRSVPVMVDALFDSPSSREFTMTELAERANLSQRSVSNRIDILYELGIIQEVSGTNRFSLNLEGAIPWTLRQLDVFIQEALENEAPSVGSFEDSMIQHLDDIDSEDVGGRSIVTAPDDPLDVSENVRKQVRNMRDLHAD